MESPSGIRPANFFLAELDDPSLHYLGRYGGLSVCPAFSPCPIILIRISRRDRRMTREPENGNGKEQRLEEHRQELRDPQDGYPLPENTQDLGKTEPYFPEIFLG